VMSDTQGYLAFYERKRGADGTLTLSAPQRVFWSEGASVFNSNGQPQNKESGLLRLNDGVYGRGGRRTFCVVDWDGDGKMDILMNSSPNVNFFRALGKDEQGRNVKNRRKSHASESPVLLVIATWWERNPNSF